MKKKFTALKMYLIGLTAGLFVFGWSTIAQSDVAQLNSTQTTAAQATASQTTASQATISQATNGTTIQTQSNSSQTVFSRPRIRTRTS